MVNALGSPLNQQLLDEWAGILAAGAIRSSPLGCLRALVKRAREGRFTPERAVRVAHAREKRRRVAAAQAQAAARMPEPDPIDEDNELVRRLADVAKRAAKK